MTPEAALIIEKIEFYEKWTYIFNIATFAILAIILILKIRKE